MRLAVVAGDVSSCRFFLCLGALLTALLSRDGPSAIEEPAGGHVADSVASSLGVGGLFLQMRRDTADLSSLEKLDPSEAMLGTAGVATDLITDSGVSTDRLVASEMGVRPPQGSQHRLP